MRATALHRTGVLWGVLATLVAMISVQSGAALAIALFAAVGPLGVVALRLASAGAFLVSTARPPAAALRTPRAGTLVAYGLVIATMNCCFYLAIERVPLGVCVALEMVGPIAIAIATSRRRRDVGAVALAVPSVVVLAFAHGVDGPRDNGRHPARARRRGMLGVLHPALGPPRQTAVGSAGPGACDGDRDRARRRDRGVHGRQRPALAAGARDRRGRRPALDRAARDDGRGGAATAPVGHLCVGAQPVARGRGAERLRLSQPAVERGAVAASRS
jgi:hypothetical protein